MFKTVIPFREFQSDRTDTRVIDAREYDHAIVTVVSDKPEEDSQVGVSIFTQCEQPGDVTMPAFLFAEIDGVGHGGRRVDVGVLDANLLITVTSPKAKTTVVVTLKGA